MSCWKGKRRHLEEYFFVEQLISFGAGWPGHPGAGGTGGGGGGAVPAGRAGPPGRQLRAGGPGRRPSLGASQHPRLWRRSRSHHSPRSGGTAISCKNKQIMAKNRNLKHRMNNEYLFVPKPYRFASFKYLLRFKYKTRPHARAILYSVPIKSQDLFRRAFFCSTDGTKIRPPNSFPTMPIFPSSILIFNKLISDQADTGPGLLHPPDQGHPL